VIRDTCIYEGIQYCGGNEIIFTGVNRRKIPEKIGNNYCSSLCGFIRFHKIRQLRGALMKSALMKSALMKSKQKNKKNNNIGISCNKL